MTGTGSPTLPDSLLAALGTATRAIAANPELSVDYASGPARIDGDRIRLPRPAPRLSARAIACSRGAGDAMALRLRHHQAAIHTRYRPPGSGAAEIFDALERARVEALGARAMPGVGKNLDAALAHELRGARPDTAPPSAATALATRLALREAAGTLPLPEEARQARELCPDVSGIAFHRLAGCMFSQADFARAARAAIATLGYGAELGDDPDRPAETESGPEDEPEPADPDSAETGAEQVELADDGTQAEAAVTVQTLSGDESPDAEVDEAAEGRPPELPHRTQAQLDQLPAYRVYCHDHDEIVDAAELCETAELMRHREALDRQVEPLRGAIGRLANRLQRRLMARQQRTWVFDLEEGLLDTARLARVVATPLSPLTFKHERESEFRDTVVTLLLDNSGSMRGRPIATAAVCAEVLGRTLERCGVQVEILGFTTRTWKGGESRARWLEAGRPPKPGRLNDLRHIVYKNAGAPWRRARRNLGLMLREGLLKENIDGEALQWAYLRLLQRPERRRILMVISDGAPIDDSTLAANGAGYLERHLREVVSAIEQEERVELAAIGIGHDVSRYYRRAVTISAAEQLAGAITDQLATLFDREHAARTPPRGRFRGPAAATRKSAPSGVVSARAAGWPDRSPPAPGTVAAPARSG